MKSPITILTRRARLPEHQLRMIAAVARAHALMLEQLTEEVLALRDGTIDRDRLAAVAQELVELTDQAAVIDAAVRRLGAPT